MHTVIDADRELLSTACAQLSGSPFVGPRYADAMRALGAKPVVFLAGSERDADILQVGYLRGRTSRPWLDLPSTHEVPDPVPFWRAFEAWCRNHRVGTVSLSSYASGAMNASALPSVVRASGRVEWVIDFQNGERTGSLGSNHKRNVAKARKTGVRVVPSADRNALSTHISLMDSSLTRRRMRGESVEQHGESLTRELGAILEHGGGRLWQAHLGEQVMSSLLVVESDYVDYYQSAGTDPEGMDCGASVLVVDTAIEAARTGGKRRFNLAGAGDDNPGLQRFKAGFGSRRVELAAGVWDLRSPVELRARELLQRARSLVNGFFSR